MRNHVSEPRFRDANDALAYLAECMLATVESLPVKTSRYQRDRHRNLAETAVRACRQFGAAGNLSAIHMGCPRLTKILQAHETLAVASGETR